MPALSDYEQERLRNIKRNQQALASFGLADAAATIKRAAKKAAAKPRIKRARPPAKEIPRRTSRRLSAAPAPAVYIKEEHSNGKVTLGGEDEAVARKATTQQVHKQDGASLADSKASGLPTRSEDLWAHEQQAFNALLQWKRSRAKELGFNDPCIICHNRTLCELVRRLPSSLGQLHRVWGVGPKRIVQHGQLMLDALEPFRAALTTAKQRTSTKASPGDGATKVATPHPRRRSYSLPSSWQPQTGLHLVAAEWAQQCDLLELPSCDWAQRRQRCADVNGCTACARYAADGKPFSYAPMSQRLLNVLAAPGAYGSHHAAHAAGWRWYATPNHGSDSHAHKWWPPEAAVQAHVPAGTKLPLGTYAAFDVVDAIFGMDA